MKMCKAFTMQNKAAALEHLQNLEKIEEFGDYCNGHYLHTWDDGHRYLCKCAECDALVLVQFSEFHGRDDSYYKDFFHVASRDEAIALNEKYDGWQIEKEYDGKRIYR